MVRAVLGMMACVGAVACGPRVTRNISFDRDPVSGLDIDRGAGEGWLGVMRGASGTGIEELEGGDLLIAGQATSAFVQRVGPDGDARWTFPLLGCDVPRIAVGGEDELYVTVRDLVALGTGTNAERQLRRQRCSRTGPNGPATVLRLNRSGEVVWRRDALSDLYETPALFAEPGRVLVMGNRRGESASSTLVAFRRDGSLEWSKELPFGFSRLDWSADAHTIVAAGSAATGSTCSVEAIDATTGELRFHRELGHPEFSHYCFAYQLSVTRHGGVLFTEQDNVRYLYGFELETGAAGFERRLRPFENPWAAAPSGRAPPELALFVDYWLEASPRGFTAGVVGIDPGMGRGAVLARFSASPPIVVDDVEVADVSWGHRSLVVTGSFYGGVAFEDMTGATAATSRTRCQSIDPGFSVGPSPKPPPPRYEAGPWRGPRRRVCPDLTYPERVHEYPLSLFAARLPLASFSAAPP